MTVNNFELIKTIIDSKTLKENDFFFVQILRRHKDAGNEDMNANNILVDVFYPTNSEDLERYKERIIKVCEMNNARAYIHLNKRNKETVALKTMALIAETIANKNYEIKRAYHSCCGAYSSEENKTWIVDIDNGDMDNSTLAGMVKVIADLVTEAGKIALFRTVPTKNGYHLIVPAFNLQKFREKYPTIDIHKDNPTILYVV